MKIEKLEKSHKNKIIVGGVVALGIMGAVTILPSFAKYRLTESINIVNGTINYKVPDLKVMAIYTSDDGTDYTEITTMPESGYVINEEKTYCTTDNVNQVKGKIKTVNGEITLKNLTKSDKCYLYFDKIKITNSTSLIANSKINVGSPDFSKIATTDEGIYATYDNMYDGQSYYFRGSVTNNYVKFANFCWRIIRINGDGSIRLIYDGATCHNNGEVTTDSIAIQNVAYNSNYNRSEYVGWTYTEGLQRPNSTTEGTDAPIKSTLENWYNTNIGNNIHYANKVADGKFCNDRNVENGQSWSSIPSNSFNYAATVRLVNAKIPILSCASEDLYTLKTGVIMADEVAFAGGVYHQTNQSYYLYNGQSYWTISPADWWFDYDAWAGEFLVSNDGQLSALSVSDAHDNMRGVRPVINLISTTTFKEGTTGTQSNPYEVI